VCVDYWLVHAIIYYGYGYIGRYITQKPVVRYIPRRRAGRVGVRSTAGATDARGRARPAPCESSKSLQYIYIYIGTYIHILGGDRKTD
jgi:hypothetical protein